MRHARYLRPNRRVFWALVIILALVAGFFVYIDGNILPVLEAMAEGRVRAMSIKAINDSVREIIKDPAQYTDMVTIIRDENGKIAMVQSDSVQLNDISTQTALAAQDRIAQMGTQGIGIPLGSLFGSQLMSGRGPNIYNRIIPVGSVSTQFFTEFENAGINQTRYRIIMNATTSVRIVMPGGGHRVDVDVQIPVFESIIVGDVPDSYVQVDDPTKLDIANRIEISACDRFSMKNRCNICSSLLPSCDKVSCTVSLTVSPYRLCVTCDSVKSSSGSSCFAARER